MAQSTKSTSMLVAPELLAQILRFPDGCRITGADFIERDIILQVEGSGVDGGEVTAHYRQCTCGESAVFTGWVKKE